jgi:tetratricopeptide (TPR) repeat protein
MDRILHAEPEPVGGNGEKIPGELDRLLQKCLQKRREDRYASASALLEELQSLQKAISTKPGELGPAKLVDLKKQKGPPSKAGSEKTGIYKIPTSPGTSLKRKIIGLAAFGVLLGWITGGLWFYFSSKKPVPGKVRTQNVNSEAYHYYLNGLAYYNHGGTENGEKALKSYQKAIDADPDLAEAYAGMANVETWYGSFGLLPGIPESRRRARSFAEKALALDSSLPESQSAMAYYKYFLEWDWKEAGARFEKAHTIDPNNVMVLLHYYDYLMAMGRIEQAILACTRLAELDPGNLRFQCILGWVYFYARRYDEAISYLEGLVKERAVTKQTAEGSFTLGYLQMNYLGKGMWQKNYDAQDGENIRALVYYKLGKKTKAEKIFADWKNDNASCWLIIRAEDMCVLGRNEEAIGWLEKGFAKRDPQMVYMKVSPLLDPIHTDPRYKALLRRMNFPE